MVKNGPYIPKYMITVPKALEEYDRYNKQVQLLLSVLTEVAKEITFALHGGTAINLFVRDMPHYL